MAAGDPSAQMKANCRIADYVTPVTDIYSYRHTIPYYIRRKSRRIYLHAGIIFELYAGTIFNNCGSLL